MATDAIDALEVLPAYAGMILSAAGGDAWMRGAPRVCGDDPAIFSPKDRFGSCSPRMRG